MEPRASRARSPAEKKKEPTAAVSWCPPRPRCGAHPSEPVAGGGSRAALDAERDEAEAAEEEVGEWEEEAADDDVDDVEEVEAEGGAWGHWGWTAQEMIDAVEDDY